MYKLLLFSSVTGILSLVSAQYSTYPSVAKTATINGFADPIYSQLPTCADACVSIDTDVTPCPYWDTGCLCVMSVWGDEVAECVASACSGTEIELMTSLATSICSSAGVPSPYWYLGSDAANDLAAAATKVVTTTIAKITSLTSSSEDISETSQAIPSATGSSIPDPTASSMGTSSDSATLSSSTTILDSSVVTMASTTETVAPSESQSSSEPVTYSSIISSSSKSLDFSFTKSESISTSTPAESASSSQTLDATNSSDSSNGSSAQTVSPTVEAANSASAKMASYLLGGTLLIGCLTIM